MSSRVDPPSPFSACEGPTRVFPWRRETGALGGGGHRSTLPSSCGRPETSKPLVTVRPRVHPNLWSEDFLPDATDAGRSYLCATGFNDRRCTGNTRTLFVPGSSTGPRFKVVDDPRGEVGACHIDGSPTFQVHWDRDGEDLLLYPRRRTRGQKRPTTTSVL